MPIKIIDLDAGRGNILIGSGILTGKEYVDAFGEAPPTRRRKV